VVLAIGEGAIPAACAQVKSLEVVQFLVVVRVIGS